MTVQTAAMRFVERSIAFAGKLTVTLSRETDALADPLKGEPVPLEVSGAHAQNATALVIAPQATWSFRGSVESGSAVTVTGHPSPYSTTAKATVSDTAPGTLTLPLAAPGLSAALSGGEVVTVGEAGAVSYDGREVGDMTTLPDEWVVEASDVAYLVSYDGKRKPAIGDTLSAPIAGSVKEIKGSPFSYCTILCGGIGA